MPNDDARLAEIERRLSDLERRLLTEDVPMNHPGRPTEAEVRLHFDSNGYRQPDNEWAAFYNHFEAQGWMTGNNVQITNWRAKASEWMRDNPKVAPTVEVKTSPLVPAGEFILIPAPLKHPEGDWADPPPELFDKLRKAGVYTKGRPTRRDDEGLTPIREVIE